MGGEVWGGGGGSRVSVGRGVGRGGSRVSVGRGVGRGGGE